MPHTAQRVPARSCLWRKLWPLQPVSSSRDSVAAAAGGARSRRVDGDDDRRLCVLVQGRRPSSPQVRLRGNLLLHRHLRRPARLHRDHRRRLEGRRHVDQPWSPQLQERLEVKACLGRAPHRAVWEGMGHEFVQSSRVYTPYHLTAGLELYTEQRPHLSSLAVHGESLAGAVAHCCSEAHCAVRQRYKYGLDHVHHRGLGCKPGLRVCRRRSRRLSRETTLCHRTLCDDERRCNLVGVEATEGDGAELGRV
mmetsp:Transcript_16551/g.39604  ORF Transcript_16551/g.39604 Transcript_16551/m.39604 type:complete len:251 (-) Transcript_16551:859-1611(-)